MNQQETAPRSGKHPEDTRNGYIALGVIALLLAGVVIWIVVANSSPSEPKHFAWEPTQADLDRKAKADDAPPSSSPTPKQEPAPPFPADRNNAKTSTKSSKPKVDFSDPNQPFGVPLRAAATKQEDDLISAAYLGNTGDVALLLSYGVNVNAKDQLGRSALQWASHWGNTDTVRYLLSHGANPNIQDSYGNTPLASAKEQHHPAVIALLKRAGAK